MPVMEMPSEEPVRVRMPSARARATSAETGPWVAMSSAGTSAKAVLRASL